TASGRLRLRREGHVRRVNVEFGPLRARERPFVLASFDEFLPGVANLKQHLWLFIPTRVLTLEKVTEEFLLQAHSIIRVEMGPMFDAVHFEPFLARSRAHKSLEISTRMQALSVPVCRGQQRCLHLGPVRHARLPVGIAIELARDTVLVEIAAVAARVLLRTPPGARTHVSVPAAL